MSRTIGHNQKAKFGHPDWDLWSRRPLAGYSRCKYNRQRTARVERKQSKRIVRSEIESRWWHGLQDEIEAMLKFHSEFTSK